MMRMCMKHAWRETPKLYSAQQTCRVPQLHDLCKVMTRTAGFTLYNSWHVSCDAKQRSAKETGQCIHMRCLAQCLSESLTHWGSRLQILRRPWCLEGPYFLLGRYLLVATRLGHLACCMWLASLCNMCWLAGIVDLSVCDQ